MKNNKNIEMTQELKIRNSESNKKSYKKLIISLLTIFIVAAAATCLIVGIKIAKG